MNKKHWAVVAAGLGLGFGQLAFADDHQLPSDTRLELAQARQGTASFHNIANAAAAGYVNADFILPGVGCHLVNEALVDFRFDPAMPELLIYATGDCDAYFEDGVAAGAELRAVEYVVPCTEFVPESPYACAGAAPTPPEGFVGQEDFWEVFGPNVLWTLHAWVWRNNPDGIFVKINPRIED